MLACLTVGDFPKQSRQLPVRLRLEMDFIFQENMLFLLAQVSVQKHRLSSVHNKTLTFRTIFRILVPHFGLSSRVQIMTSGTLSFSSRRHDIKVRISLSSSTRGATLRGPLVVHRSLPPIIKITFRNPRPTVGSLRSLMSSLSAVPLDWATTWHPGGRGILTP